MTTKTKPKPKGVVSSKSPQSREYFQAWMPKDLYRRLKAQASRNQRTIGAEVRFILGSCLDAVDKPRLSK